MGVTDREIRREIDEGARTMDAIGCRTGAGTSCGSCRGDIATMLSSAGLEQRAACPAPDGCDSKRRLALVDDRHVA